jgi:sulfotransferase
MSINPDKTYHFITGLPRAGSTLLSGILKQNPRFHASITDPLATLVKGMVESCQDGPGMKKEVPVERRKNLVRHVMEGYYADVDKPVIFNTNRAWTLLPHLMKDLYPKSKMVVCVRDIKWIMDSFELAHRRDPLSTNTMFGGLSGTVYSRMDSLMTDTGVVGFPYIGVKQAITSAEKNMLMLVEYDQLCKNPAGILKALYNFIGEPFYEHDFKNVEASWDEYDSEIGMKLHEVKRKVEYKSRETILPPDIINKYSNMEVWRM